MSSNSNSNHQLEQRLQKLEFQVHSLRESVRALAEAMDEPLAASAQRDGRQSGEDYGYDDERDRATSPSFERRLQILEAGYDEISKRQLIHSRALRKMDERFKAAVTTIADTFAVITPGGSMGGGLTSPPAGVSTEREDF